jgi:hypothetical protein
MIFLEMVSEWTLIKKFSEWSFARLVLDSVKGPHDLTLKGPRSHAAPGYLKVLRGRTVFININNIKSE